MYADFVAHADGILLSQLPAQTPLPQETKESDHAFGSGFKVTNQMLSDPSSAEERINQVVHGLQSTMQEHNVPNANWFIGSRVLDGVWCVVLLMRMN